MTKDDFEVAMRRWGWVYGEKPDSELPESARAPAVHPIARAMEFGTRGTGRRLDPAYARKVQPGERSWSRDPIPCKESRQAVGSAPVAPPKDDMAPVVQAAWLRLWRVDRALADVVRLEYQVRDLQQHEKARELGVGRGKYREMLAEGKGWLFARLSQAKAA